jgi:hypothetical protein
MLLSCFAAAIRPLSKRENRHCSAEWQYSDDPYRSGQGSSDEIALGHPSWESPEFDSAPSGRSPAVLLLQRIRLARGRLFAVEL